tara:strand:- start:173 stop:1159 length:987 start_codon:yes stop_codon:yes gene_type:complete
MSNTAMMMGLSSGAGGVDVADVFSTTLYTGNATADTKITTGVDLQTNGGLLWTKKRSASADHYLWDSINAFDGGTSTTYSSKRIKSNENDAMSTEANALMSFETDGFVASTNGAINGNGSTYVSWSFLQASKFFDVVQYSGTGAAQAISHNLNNEVGMILIKQTSSGLADWSVYHRSLGGTKSLRLDDTRASVTNNGYFADTDATSTEFTVGGLGDINGSGSTYVAYLFAHNEDLIQCGSFSGNDATVNVTLGFQPQFIIVKNSNTAGNWNLYDSERGAGAYLFADATQQEYTDSSPDIVFNSTGFDASGNFGVNGRDYIYVAIKAED